MAVLSQSRRFALGPTASGLPLYTDLVTGSRHVSKVPKGDIAPGAGEHVKVLSLRVRIATGEIGDITTEDDKNAAAVALGRMGGKARAAGMTAKTGVNPNLAAR